MFAHGDDDLREPVYDLTVPPVEHNTSGLDKIAVKSEQCYHFDPKWCGKLLPYWLR